MKKSGSVMLRPAFCMGCAVQVTRGVDGASEAARGRRFTYPNRPIEVCRGCQDLVVLMILLVVLDLVVLVVGVAGMDGTHPCLGGGKKRVSNQAEGRRGEQGPKARAARRESRVPTSFSCNGSQASSSRLTDNEGLSAGNATDP